jgi:hypothetical protein
VRPDERISAVDAALFAATDRACSVVGCHYRRVGVVDDPLAANAVGLRVIDTAVCNTAMPRGA